MTNLIINKNGTLYTLPDSVSCGTVNGVDIKEIEVNNNGSLITVWKLQSDVSIEVFAKYTMTSSKEEECSYWLKYNNEYYSIIDRNVFKCVYNNQTYTGRLTVTHGTDNVAPPSSKAISQLYSNVYGFRANVTPTLAKSYTPCYGSENYFFDKRLQSVSLKSIKGSSMDSASSYSTIKTKMASSTHRYSLGAFTITGEQFKQATGVNP